MSVASGFETVFALVMTVFLLEFVADPTISLEIGGV
jgi:hypothetical protein